METREHESGADANPELLALAGRISNGAEAPGAGGGAAGDARAESGERAPGDAEQGAQVLGLARTVVGAVCKAIAARWPAAVYSPEEQTVMAGLLVPVWLKHVKAPWFTQWQEEIAAGGFALYMGYTGWDRVRAAEKAAEPVPDGDRASAPGAV